jgi:hypothetical protein
MRYIHIPRSGLGVGISVTSMTQASGMAVSTNERKKKSEKIDDFAKNLAAFDFDLRVNLGNAAIGSAEIHPMNPSANTRITAAFTLSIDL